MLLPLEPIINCLVIRDFILQPLIFPKKSLDDFSAFFEFLLQSAYKKLALRGFLEKNALRIDKCLSFYHLIQHRFAVVGIILKQQLLKKTVIVFCFVFL